MSGWNLVESISTNGIRVDLLTKGVPVSGDYDVAVPELEVVIRVSCGAHDYFCSTVDELFIHLGKHCEDVVVFVREAPLFFARTFALITKSTRPIFAHPLYRTLPEGIDPGALLPHVDNEGVLHWSTVAFENGKSVVRWEEQRLIARCEQRPKTS